MDEMVTIFDGYVRVYKSGKVEEYQHDQWVVLKPEGMWRLGELVPVSYFTIGAGKRRRRMSAMKLVAEAFGKIPDPVGRYTARPKDFDIFNLSLDNIDVLTQLQSTVYMSEVTANGYYCDSCYNYYSNNDVCERCISLEDKLYDISMIYKNPKLFKRNYGNIVSDAIDGYYPGEIIKNQTTIKLSADTLEGMLDDILEFHPLTWRVNDKTNRLAREILDKGFVTVNQLVEFNVTSEEFLKYMDENFQDSSYRPYAFRIGDSDVGIFIKDGFDVEKYYKG